MKTIRLTRTLEFLLVVFEGVTPQQLVGALIEIFGDKKAWEFSVLLAAEAAKTLPEAQQTMDIEELLEMEAETTATASPLAPA